MIVELAVAAGIDGLAHRVDRFLEAAELLVGIGEFIEVLRAVRLGLGQRERTRDQPHAGVVVIALAGDDQFALDRLKIGHAPKANQGTPPRSTGDGRTQGGVAATPNPVGDKPIWPRGVASVPVALHQEVAAMPSSLAGLLSLLAPCFTHPTFQTFSMLLVGMVGRIRDCTVTGMLQAAGLAGVWHHSRAHDFFARARWDPDELGLALLDFLVSVFVKAGAPIRLAVDDTLFGRSGPKVWGAHYLHDGAQPEGSGRRTRWGNCWVVVVLVVELRCLGGRHVALPVLFRLFRPKDDDHPDRPSQPELARLLIDMVLKRFPRRTVELVMDGAYASKAWRNLPSRVSVTTRMRGNARVHELTPARQAGQKGRPPLKGRKLPTLGEIAKTAVFQQVTVTGPDGR